MFSNDKNVETIGQLVEVLKHYIGLQSEYMKLDVVDKVVRLLTAITMTVVLLGLFLIAIIYLSFAAAYVRSNSLRRRISFSELYSMISSCSIISLNIWNE